MTPPEPPNGEAPSGQPGANAPGAPGSMGGADTMSFDYKGQYAGEVTADGSEETVSGQTISATDADRNAGLTINGGTLAISESTLEKAGDDTDGDRCNFYGANSIVLAVNEASKAILSDVALKATSQGSNGLFATDSATVYANNTNIETTADNARGLDATYGGTIVANGLRVQTQGAHCAAIATDRGGGNISVSSSTLSTAGSGSPLLYSTGDIEVDNVTGTATGSQLVGMEGLNSVIISNSTLASEQTGKTASDPIADGVIIYQSTSGDAEAKTGDTALFQATNSTLTSAIESGAMFYLTNTQARIVLSRTDLEFDSEAAKLIVAAGNDANNWGKAGANGATATFIARDEHLEGDIEVDTISELDFYLLEGSTWKGASAIVDNETASTRADHLNVNIEAASTWVVTDDSTVSNLNVGTGGKLVDAKFQTVKVKDSDGNVLVDGTSDITVTVLGAFSTTVTTTDANVIEPASIDRTAFDATFGTSTAFGTNGTSSTGASSATGSQDAAQARALAAKEAIIEWFRSLKN